MLNRVLLRGDKGRAAQWIPFAEQKILLADISAGGRVMNHAPMRPNRCVTIQIRSLAGGINIITIHHCAGGGKCIFPVPDIDGGIMSEFLLECPVQKRGRADHLIIVNTTDYYPWDSRAEYGGTWDWGDPATSQHPTDLIERRSYANGTFTPSLTTFTGGNLPVEGEAVIQQKSATGATPGDAYAAWLAKPWEPGGGGTVFWGLTDTGSFGFLKYRYEGTKKTITYHLDDVFYTLDPANTAYFYLTTKTTSSVDDLTGRLGFANGSPAVLGDGVTQVLDLSGSIGGSVAVLLTMDYTPLPTPTGAPFRNIYQVNEGGPLQNVLRTTKTIILKRDGTIKQVGDSVHERLPEFTLP